MRKTISLFVVLFVAISILSAVTWAEESFETFDDLQFSFIFMNDMYSSNRDAAYANDMAIVMGGRSGKQFALVRENDVVIISDKVAEHFDLFKSIRVDGKGDNFFINDFKTFITSKDGINWSKFELGENERLFYWDGGYRVIDGNLINIIDDDFIPTNAYKLSVDYLDGYYYWKADLKDNTPVNDNEKILRSKDLLNWTMFIDDMKEGDFQILDGKDGHIMVLDYDEYKDHKTHYYTDYIGVNTDGKAKVLASEEHVKGHMAFERPTNPYAYNHIADEYYAAVGPILYVSKDKDADKWTMYDALDIVDISVDTAKSKWSLKSDGTYEIICGGQLINIDSTSDESIIHKRTLSNGLLEFVYDNMADRTYGYDVLNNIYRINENGLWEQFSKIDADFFEYAGIVDGIHYGVTANEDEAYNLIMSTDGFSWRQIGQFPTEFKAENVTLSLILDVYNSSGDTYRWNIKDQIRSAQVSKNDDGILILVNVEDKEDSKTSAQFFNYAGGNIKQLAVSPKLVPLPNDTREKYFYKNDIHNAFGKSVVTGMFGTLATSTGGDTWNLDFDVYNLVKTIKTPEFDILDTSSTPSFGSHMASIGDYIYFPITNTKKIIRTGDLETFKILNMNIPSIIRSEIAFRYGRYYGVGTDGKLYESNDFINWSAIGEGIALSLDPRIKITFNRGEVIVQAEKIYRFKIQ